MNPVTVTITRPRDPLEGESLAVLGRVHRHGRLELLVALPDGSKRLVPAQWTDHDTVTLPRNRFGRGGGHGGAVRGSAGRVRAGVGAFGPAGRGAGCTATTVQGGLLCSLRNSVCCRIRFRRHPRR